MIQIAKTKGNGSNKAKGEIVRRLLVQAKGEEVRYLVVSCSYVPVQCPVISSTLPSKQRTLVSHLRIGAVRLVSVSRLVSVKHRS